MAEFAAVMRTRAPSRQHSGQSGMCEEKEGCPWRTVSRFSWRPEVLGYFSMAVEYLPSRAALVTIARW